MTDQEKSGWTPANGPSLTPQGEKSEEATKVEATTVSEPEKTPETHELKSEGAEKTVAVDASAEQSKTEPQPSQSTTPTQETWSNPDSSNAQKVTWAEPVSATTISDGGANNVVYQEGCLGAAWSDITKTNGWFKTVAKMGLVEFVPILRWFNAGYCMRWARQLIFGKLQEMPKSVFGDRNFANGFYCFLIQLVVYVIVCFANFALGLIPLIGLFIALVFAVFASMYENVMIIRTAIFDDIGSGFGLTEIFRSSKGHLGTLFGIWFLPSFVTGLIAMCIVCVVLGINMLISGADLVTYFTNLIYQYGGAVYLGSAISTNSALAASIGFAILRAFAILLPGILISWYLCNICSVVSMMIAFRATGHFAARWCGEWRSDPRFQQKATMESAC